MIGRLSYVESAGYDPYANLAVEEYLLSHCRKNECILYLWQNQRTVVIGKNQNAWAECRTEELEKDNGHLARRLSGGGAVYHDLGNLNFTFVTDKEHFDVPRQLEVIQGALQSLGIPAEKSGRNDLVLHGRKFSGNAFYRQEGFCYHHGTIMVDVQVEEMLKYLTVSKEKLSSNGVASVKARVANLIDDAPELTIGKLKHALKGAFEKAYGRRSDTICTDTFDRNDIRRAYERLRSWEWLYGRKLDFQYELSHRFGWGQLTIDFQVQEGRIKDLAAYTDALYPGVIDALPSYLKGLRYSGQAICAKLRTHLSPEEPDGKRMADILTWLKTVDF